MVKKSQPAKLVVEKRKITGHRVKKLRKQGILPANIYGKAVKSLAVSLARADFMPVYEQLGETGLVELKVKGEGKIRPVLIHNLQLDPISDQPLHVDFYQVNLKEKVTSSIPIELVGEAPAVAKNIGVLIQPLTEIEVEALPAELPEKFEVNISNLKAVDEAVTVADLKVPSGVKIITDQKEILAKIEPFAKEEEAAPTAKEGEEAVPTEKEAAATAETKTEGEEKPAESEEKAAEKSQK